MIKAQRPEPEQTTCAKCGTEHATGTNLCCRCLDAALTRDISVNEVKHPNLKKNYKPLKPIA